MIMNNFYHRESLSKADTGKPASGNTQGAKMFFGGAFGMKNAVQQSTKAPMDIIMGQFIRNLNASANTVAQQ